ncbi:MULTISPECIES: DMT family transporter [Streptomyces]|uniref:EmrE protein n=2 Tax=Streptomyces TaxID=1883 RepID=D9WAH6_9ACTN|nr:MULTISPECIES: multidrug efflux SMR transporter [Streptomyces]EFL26917.1 EmrE protein [Streptomyces himastatinicus ATCC 53653]RNF81615.1 multidrug efflux SMR transporter [Streptomyces botrytidirepellens]
MAYLLLLAAITAELIGTSLLKSTAGFSRPGPALACLASYAVACFLLARAIHDGMQVGVGYALWSGLGTALIVVIGLLFLGEPLTAAKALGVALVIGGVITLNLGSTQ